MSVDTLAIDMNGVIHTCAQKVYEYGNFEPKHRGHRGHRRKRPRRNQDRRVFAAVAEYVDMLRRSVRPKKRLLLCVDGVAGAAMLVGACGGGG